MIVSAADRDVLLKQLDALSRAVEQLLSAGMTTAGESTRETLDVTFREASRLKLLRVASTLRAANEEIGRYISGHDDFSSKRLAFFLNRAWLLARGLMRALRENDSAEWNRLLWTPKSNPIERIEVVTLGVGKKLAKGSFCSFEFRLRRINNPGPSESQATRLTWSCIFPMKPGVEVPPEGFLQMPQRQKFKASEFLDGRIMTLTGVMVSADEWGGGRVSLTDSSTVTAGDPYAAWSNFAAWSAIPLLDRIQKHEVGPFDLEIELQDEIVLKEWSVDTTTPVEREGQWVFPVDANGMRFDAVVSQGVDGQTLKKRLEELAKSKSSRPPLFGLLHFDRCRPILQPLSLLTEAGPELITISREKIDKAALLKTLNF